MLYFSIGFAYDGAALFFTLHYSLILGTMTQKEITINGQQYPVVFTMDTLMNFERIVSKSFFETDFKTLTDRMALIIAAVITANEKTTLTVEAMKGNNDLKAVQQIIAAYNIVAALMGEFFDVPEVVKQAEAEEQQPTNEGDEKPKN